MIILGTNSIKDTGYDVANSLRFNSGSSDYLNRTLSTPTNRRKWTFSMWVKRSNISSASTSYLLSVNSSQAYVYFNTDDTFNIEQYSGGYQYRLKTNRVFRDTSAWYHLVIRFDSTNGTADDRVRIYINGVQETSFSARTNPSLNFDGAINNNNAHFIGRDAASYWGGYMSEITFIDGQSLDPTSFGEFDEDSPTIWKPKDVSGLTFGTNGFHLDFENASSLGADVSGNSNNFTVNNLTSIDQSTDTCTLNYATKNPLDVHPGGTYTFTDGNLTVEQNISRGTLSTFGLSSGKWYAEAKFISTSGSDCIIGVVGINTTANEDPGIQATGYMYNQDGTKKNNNSSSSYGNSYTTGDIVGIALDLDNNKIYFSKNGTFQNSGDPTSGSSGTGSAFTLTDPASTPTGFYFFAHADELSTNKVSWNYGSAPYTISSGNSDGNGYGNFEYAVPSGYYALNTKNLAEYG